MNLETAASLSPLASPSSLRPQVASITASQAEHPLPGVLQAGLADPSLGFRRPQQDGHGGWGLLWG